MRSSNREFLAADLLRALFKLCSMLLEASCWRVCRKQIVQLTKCTVFELWHLEPSPNQTQERKSHPYEGRFASKVGYRVQRTISADNRRDFLRSNRYSALTLVIVDEVWSNEVHNPAHQGIGYNCQTLSSSSELDGADLCTDRPAHGPDCWSVE